MRERRAVKRNRLGSAITIARQYWDMALFSLILMGLVLLYIYLMSK